MIAALAAALISNSFPMDSRSANNLKDVQPSLRILAEAFLKRTRADFPDVRVKVIEGFRSYDTQADDYAKGRTAPGKKVTWAPPGFSFHNFGYAFDVGVFRAGVYSQDAEDYEMLSDSTPEHLDWGGNFSAKKKDIPHYEEKVYSLSQMRGMHDRNEDIPDNPSWANLTQQLNPTLASFPSQDGTTDRASFLTALRDLKNALLHGRPLLRRDVAGLLPKTAVMGSPQWAEDDQAVGNVAPLHGTIQGNVIFLSDEQSEAVSAGHDPVSTDYSPDDPVAGVQIFLADTVRGDALIVRQKIENLVRKELGFAPHSTILLEQKDNAVNVNGYCVSWKLHAGPEFDLWQNWYGHKWTLCLYLNRQDLRAQSFSG
jgi:peptidoglycan L-alanyl-D-glutamate endopeptidase CwlK